MEELTTLVRPADPAGDWSEQIATPLLGVLVIAAVALWIARPRRKYDWDEDGDA